jgi:predicted O-methyltransferase YrrM
MPASPQTLARLLAAGPPLQATDWSLADAALEAVLAELGRGRRRIVECGCGRSTVVIARALRALGGGELYSLEHHPAWAQLCRAQLAAEGLTEIAAVIEAPLDRHPRAQPGCLWYSGWALAQLPDSAIELLLVDGPPAGEPAIARSRYPALPALAGRLAAGAVVILDDIGRRGERWVLDRWEAEHGLRFERREAEEVAIGVYFPPGTQNLGMKGTLT